MRGCGRDSSDQVLSDC